MDKTNMIKDFLDYSTEVTLITRPRGFGKTLNLCMLAEFFDIMKDSKDIFTDTNIMRTAYVNKMNQYPVIFLSFKDCKGKQKDMITILKRILLMAYKKANHV